MPFQSIEPRRLYRQIADQIRTLIRSGEFPAGARLPPERDLAKQLGVSRPSVREALIALEVEGLVEVRIGSGIYVQARDGPAARSAAERPRTATARRRPGPFELLRARYVIEGEMRGARREVGEEGARARDRGSARRRCSTNSTKDKQPLAGDRLFHVRIAEATGNGALVAVVEDAVGGAHRPAVQAARASLRLAGAVASRDGRASRGAEGDCRAATPPRARAAMQRHLNQAYKRFSTGWDRVSRPQATCRDTKGIEHAGLPNPRQGRPAHRTRRYARRRAPAKCCCVSAPAGICGSDLHYYFEGRNGSFVVREPLIPGPRSLRRRRRGRPRRHPREAGRQGRDLAVARVRPLRVLP